MDKQSYPETWASRRALLASPPLDYGQWADKEHWSISEAGKLLCGRNPHAKIPGLQLFNRHKRVIDLIDEAFAAAQSGAIPIARNALLPIHLQVKPAAFIRWAIDHGFEIPPGFQHLGAEELQLDEKSRVVRERVVTIAQTLRIVDPDITNDGILNHRAMRTLVAAQEASDRQIASWVMALL